MTRSLTRPATAALLVGLLCCLLLVLQTVKLPENSIAPAPPLPDPRTDRPVQALYQLDAEAAANGWTSAQLVTAGDLWRELGDERRAVAFWEAANPDPSVLHDRAQADIDLGRWADASDALSQLLALLPSASTDRAWAQFQLGLIRLSADPAQGVELLQAAQPTYGAQVTALLASLTDVTDPTRIGIALADAKLWPYAELAFEQAVGDPLALAYGGWVRDMQGKDGTDWIETAVTLAPQDAEVRLLQGLHLRAEFDYPDSLRAIIQAVALDPDNAALYSELGKAYELTGDMTSAEHWLEYAVSLDSRFQPMLDAFHNDEASTLEGLGLTDEATVSPDATLSPAP